MGGSTMKLSLFAIKWLARSLTKAHLKQVKTYPDDSKYRAIKDIPYVDEADDLHRFNIYYAEEGKRLNRTLVDIHGGAYIFMDRSGNYLFAKEFLDAGYDVVTIDYPHNNGKLDSKEQLRCIGIALSFLASKADEYHMATPFYLTGDSAGGHFALLVAEAMGRKDIQEKVGFSLGDFQAKAVAVNCPVYDYVGTAATPLLSKRARKFMFGPRYDDKEYVTSISPKTYLSELKIPLFYSSAKHDMLFEEFKKLSEDVHALSLDKAESIFIESDDKAVGHVHNVTDPSHPESKKVNDRMLEFFEKFA